MRYKDSIIFSNTKYFDVFFKKKSMNIRRPPSEQSLIPLYSTMQNEAWSSRISFTLSVRAVIDAVNDKRNSTVTSHVASSTETVHRDI